MQMIKMDKMLSSHTAKVTIMTKRKKIICIISVVLLLVLFIIWLLCNARISNNTERITESVYETASTSGGYEYFSLNMGYGSILSEDDYHTIAAGSCGIWNNVPEQCHWDWDIKSVHTLSYGVGACTYIHDNCTITGSDGTVYSGYDRHIRIDWKRNADKHRYEVADTYEYITPEFPCNAFDFLDGLFSK